MPTVNVAVAVAVAVAEATRLSRLLRLAATQSKYLRFRHRPAPRRCFLRSLRESRCLPSRSPRGSRLRRSRWSPPYPRILRCRHRHYRSLLGVFPAPTGPLPCLPCLVLQSEPGHRRRRHRRERHRQKRPRLRLRHNGQGEDRLRLRLWQMGMLPAPFRLLPLHRSPPLEPCLPQQHSYSDPDPDLDPLTLCLIPRRSP